MRERTMPRLQDRTGICHCGKTARRKQSMIWVCDDCIIKTMNYYKKLERQEYNREFKFYEPVHVYRVIR